MRKSVDPFVRIGPSATERPQAVVVLGAARGGTSMVAGVLRILGVDLGADINSANNEDRVFLTHKGDRRIFNEPGFAEKRATYIQQARRYIQRRNESGNLWGWKDPLVSHYIHDVADILVRPIYIAVTRDLAAIAIRELAEAAPSNHPPDPAAHALNAAKDYIRITQFLAFIKNGSLLLSYERALRQPERVVSAIGELLHLDISLDVAAKAAKFIKPDKGAAHID